MKHTCVIFALLPMLCLWAVAEEGMWLLNQLNGLNLKEKGLEIPVEKIYSPHHPCLAHAVVDLGGGTASFVSPEGLLLTNHHVALGAVQRISSEEQNYMQTGFLAASRAEEMQAPGYAALVLKEMRDVTEEVLAACKGIEDPVERTRASNAKIQQIKENIEAGKDDIAASVASMYLGRQYVLFVHQKFEDVRLVYVPPMEIGNYGGDIDNWMWPRHTGDFSFLRVYMAPDGSGRPYHEENVPYRPSVWLTISEGNLNEGDFTFILGYPGYTMRYRTSYSVAYNLNCNYPDSIRNFKEIIVVLEDVSRNDPEAAIQTASLNDGLNNTMKNYQGKVDGMVKTSFLEKKRQFERELKDFIASDEKLRQKYGDIFSKIEAEYKVIYANRIHDNAIENFDRGITLLSIARRIYYVVSEMAKPESERAPDFSKRRIEKEIQQVKYFYYSYCESADRALLKRALNKANELPEGSRIEGIEAILAGDIAGYVEEAYRNTKLHDVEYVQSLYTKTPAELESLGDPLIALAKMLYRDQEEVRNRYEKFAANITDLRRQYMEALYEWKGRGLYPDANDTIRFTYGHVAGYTPRDAVWYRPFTTLSGVVAKDTGVEPFAVPEELKILSTRKDFGRWSDPELEDIPVAFTHRCDITGGNSGSPVLNARGELVGIAFDGNYEGMVSDWQYDYDFQRTISVDIRYVLFLTEKMAKAEYLLEEMGVK